MAPECCGCARCHQWCVGPNMGYSVLCDGGMDPSTRFSGSGFSNIGRTEPNHVASRDGTSIARPHCSIGFCHSTCDSRTPAYHDTEWQSPSDLRGHYPAAAGRLQCAHGRRSKAPRCRSNADVRSSGGSCSDADAVTHGRASSCVGCVKRHSQAAGRRAWDACSNIALALRLQRRWEGREVLGLPSWPFSRLVGAAGQPGQDWWDVA
jgi:hypothetical protein